MLNLPKLSPLVLLLSASCGLATAAEGWHMQDPEGKGKIQGASVLKAYEANLIPDNTAPVIVAVIDSGMQIDHPDLVDVLWTNTGEAEGKPGVDDDGNGYIDDTHGWNFLGSADGKTNITIGGRALTREVARLRALLASDQATDADKALLKKLEPALARSVKSAQSQYWAAAKSQAMYETSLQVLKSNYNLQEVSIEAVKKLPVADPIDDAKRAYVQAYLEQQAKVDARTKRAEDSLRIAWNTEFREETLLGDPTDPTNPHYGNNKLSIPATDYHGTHVAGIIGATRGNKKGIEGIAPARIMTLRVVPTGDERDKDIAHAIRYACDNGAKIINMSFGKGFSPLKDLVDDAARYARSKDVLLIHAAGNSAKNLDSSNNFPNGTIANPKDGETARLDNWITVGASGPKSGKALPANFSNYGKKNVDIFAPGVQINSTVPGSGYSKSSGTSMAAPVVAGVAALIRGVYPELSAAEVKDILLSSARQYPKVKVQVPGQKKQAPFADLSVCGGIVDAHAALLLAAERSGKGKTENKPEQKAAEEPAQPEQKVTEEPAQPADQAAEQTETGKE